MMEPTRPIDFCIYSMQDCAFLHQNNCANNQAVASTVIPSSTLTTIPKSSVQTSVYPQTSQLPIFKKKKPFNFVTNKVLPCKAMHRNRNQATTAGSKNSGESSLNRLDRRDVLIGLGGLYGVTNLANGNDQFALAAPIPGPDFTHCKDATIGEGNPATVYCCPPTAEIIDFKPPYFSKICYRPAAHLVDPDYLVKFSKALELMKALPDEDSRSFK